MTDTPEHIRKKQNEIWLSKPVAERFALACSAIDEMNKQTEDRIKRQNPGISEGDMRAEFIRQMYKDELAPEYLEDVMKWVREKYQEKSRQSAVGQ
jgi:hypothetical protein